MIAKAEKDEDILHLKKKLKAAEINGTQISTDKRSKAAKQTSPQQKMVIDSLLIDKAEMDEIIKTQKEVIKRQRQNIMELKERLDKAQMGAEQRIEAEKEQILKQNKELYEQIEALRATVDSAANPIAFNEANNPAQDYEMHKAKLDYLFFLPWHFAGHLMLKENKWIRMAYCLSQSL